MQPISFVTGSEWVSNRPQTPAQRFYQAYTHAIESSALSSYEKIFTPFGGVAEGFTRMQAKSAGYTMYWHTRFTLVLFPVLFPDPV
jgi:hypothetical protein